MKTKLKKTKLKEMNYKQLKKAGITLHPYVDNDGDGVKNKEDCRPLNPNKHVILPAIAGAIGKGAVATGITRAISQGIKGLGEGKTERLRIKKQAKNERLRIKADIKRQKREAQLEKRRLKQEEKLESEKLRQQDQTQRADIEMQREQANIERASQQQARIQLIKQEDKEKELAEKEDETREGNLHAIINSIPQPIIDNDDRLSSINLDLDAGMDISDEEEAYLKTKAEILGIDTIPIKEETNPFTS